MSRVILASGSCITPATVAPIEPYYAKQHLRSISDADDDLVDTWIMAATHYFEEQTGRPIMKATWEYWLDAFPIETKIELPHPPLVSVTSVSYIDSNGVLVTFDDGASPATNLWQVAAPAGVYARRGWIEPVYGSVWPLARTEAGAVRIRYIAGYADNSDEVPALIKQALLLLVAQFDQFRSHTFEGRVAELPFGVDEMIRAFKYSAYPSQVLHTW